MPARDETTVAAVVFDLDGVLVDSEQLWDEARRALATRYGRPWPDGATRAMMGMSSREWPVYVRDEVGVPLDAGAINDAVVGFVLDRYSEHLPLLPGALDAVRRLATSWPLGLASSSNRPVIERFLDVSGLRTSFATTVSSEEVSRGKPAPDVYLAAAEQLGVDPAACVAVEDSSNGIRAGVAAGLAVVAVPNEHFPPAADALALARVTIDDLDALTVDLVEHARTA